MVLSTLVQPVSQCRRGWFIHDPAYIQAGDLTGFLGGLALGIVKVGRYGDHRFGHFITEIILGRFLHFLKHHGTDLLGRILPAINVNANRIIVTLHHFITPVADLFRHFIKTATHETLHTTDGVMRISDGLALGRITHFALAILKKSHYRWGRATPFFISYDNRFIAFHNGYATVGGS